MDSKLFLLLIFLSQYIISQDLSQGYIANDLTPHPMLNLNKPGYLNSDTDPSFSSTTITRISDVGSNVKIVPMYSTIQSWNADETLLIVYEVGSGHKLLHGTNYTLVRNINDINPDDVEGVFWHFSNPAILFYIDNSTADLISYNVTNQVKTTLVNLNTASGCSEGITGGNDVQMMSWDSDVISFRCGNTSAYYYRISTGTTTQFNIGDLNFTAPMPFPSGNLFYHNKKVYNASGNFVRDLNVDNVEHSCLGKLSNGNDAYFAIAFEEGPTGGCQGTLVAHNATNGNCISVTPTVEYGYPQSGTHISALAHKNTQGGWVAVSMIGYDRDGQELLDQELLIAKVNTNSADVYRVAHHRSDEDEFNYWGEPHVTISPSGTRLLFGSDWSGTQDGDSVDAYIAELGDSTLTTDTYYVTTFNIFPNPVNSSLFINTDAHFIDYTIYTADGKNVMSATVNYEKTIDVSTLINGIYFIKLTTDSKTETLKFMK